MPASEMALRQSSLLSGRCRRPAGRQPRLLATLAASYAEAGQFPKAVETAQRALDVAKQQGNSQLSDGLNAMIALYQAGKPFREKP